MRLEFVTVDVFTERRFGGNPLAVVFDGDRLSTAQMQSIAGEFNLSETTFVLPPKEAAHTAEVRIFTPRAELPFAGHPNLGTAFVLANRGSVFGRPIGDSVVFEERAGLVPLELLREGTTTVGARLTAPQPLSRGKDIAADVIAAACSIAVEDVETRHHPPCIASCGIAFVIAELKTVRALQGAQPRPDAFFRDLAAADATGIHLYARDGADGVNSGRGCLPRSTACPRTRRPAAPIWRSPPCWRACGPSPTWRCDGGSLRGPRWAARACSTPRPRSGAAASSRPGSAGAASRS